MTRIRAALCALRKELHRGMTEDEYQKELNKIKENNRQKQYKMLLKQEKNKYSESKHIETSKLLAVYLFLLLNTIVIYSMTAMWVFTDFTYLGVLISDIAAQVIVYAIYCMKAYHGKKQSEQVKLERDKIGISSDTNIDCDTTDPTDSSSRSDFM